jgi:hypothetical protein
MQLIPIEVRIFIQAGENYLKVIDWVVTKNGTKD